MASYSPPVWLTNFQLQDLEQSDFDLGPHDPGARTFTLGAF